MGCGFRANGKGISGPRSVLFGLFLAFLELQLFSLSFSFAPFYWIRLTCVWFDFRWGGGYLSKVSR